MSKLGKAVKWLAGIGVVGGVVAASVLYGPALYAKWKGPVTGVAGGAKAQAVKFYAARKGELKIVVTEDGKLRAVKNHRIFPELRGGAKITFLAPEGTTVKKGDLLVSFDKKTYDDNLQIRKGELEAARRGLTVAEEALKIEQKTVEGNVKVAETKLDEALNAYKVFQESEGPKKLNDLEGAISEARNKLSTAAKTLAEAQAKMQGELFIEDDKKKVLDREVRNAKESLESFKKMLDTSIVQRKTYRAYDYPQSLKSKKQATENAALDLEKAKVQAKSQVLQKEAEVAKIKDQITRMERDVKNFMEQIEKCDLKAPVDGLVVYGDPENQRYYYGEQIKVGAEWYGGNTLMTIPDLSAFEVDISVPEEYRGKLQVGCKATLSVEAIPGLSIGGELKKLSDLARSRQQWDQNSPKVFDGVIKPSGHDKRMVSGMTTRVEIVAEILNDVLMVPIEAVVNENGEPVCYVKKDQGTEKRKVKPGKSNDHFVQVLEGLDAGEQVDLSPTRAGDEGKAQS